MQDDDLAELTSQSNIVRLASHKIWMAVAVDIFDHELVGMQAKVPKPQDPRRPSWPYMNVWLWMVSKAQRKAYQHTIGRHKVTLQRGQLIVAERHLAKLANWSRKSARGFLIKLRQHEMIETSALAKNGQFVLDFSGHKKGPGRDQIATMVTICNYDIYQFRLQTQGTTSGTKRAHQGTKNLHGDRDTVVDKKDSKPASIQYDRASLRADDRVIENLLSWHTSHDEAQARIWLNELIETYGEGPCRSAYATLTDRLANPNPKKPIKSPVGLWRTLAKAAFTDGRSPREIYRDRKVEQSREARRIIEAWENE